MADQTILALVIMTAAFHVIVKMASKDRNPVDIKRIKCDVLDFIVVTEKEATMKEEKKNQK